MSSGWRGCSSGCWRCAATRACSGSAWWRWTAPRWPPTPRWKRTAATIAEQVSRMMAETADAREDRRFGGDHGAALPRGLPRREERLPRLRACQARLERQAAARQQEKIDARAAEEQASGKRRRGRKPKAAEPEIGPDRVANPTAPASGIMKTR